MNDAKKPVPHHLLRSIHTLAQPPGMKIIRYGRLVFICPSRFMVQLAKDLICCLRHDDFPRHEKHVLIYVGVHYNFGRCRFWNGYKIGLQTEQIYDETGKVMWGANRFDNQANIEQAFMFLDGLLDLNVGNLAFYKSERQAGSKPVKLVFGPFVFPGKKIDFLPGSTVSAPSVLFYGSLGAQGSRRRSILKKFDRFKVVMPDRGVFGDDLSRIMKRCDAVLNIHFDDGVYAEVPRLLSAYLHGKPMMSEPLGKFFEVSKHYLSLEHGDLKDCRTVFDEFSQLVTSEYTFSSALRDLGVW